MNTIGDLELLSDEAPIQIGNYVWNDAGRDSVKAFHPYKIVFGKNANLSQFDTTESQLAVNGYKYHLTLANVGAGWHKDWNEMWSSTPSGCPHVPVYSQADM